MAEPVTHWSAFLPTGVPESHDIEEVVCDPITFDLTFLIYIRLLIGESTSCPELDQIYFAAFEPIIRRAWSPADPGETLKSKRRTLSTPVRLCFAKLHKNWRTPHTRRGLFADAVTSIDVGRN